MYEEIVENIKNNGVTITVRLAMTRIVERFFHDHLTLSNRYLTNTVAGFYTDERELISNLTKAPLELVYQCEREFKDLNDILKERNLTDEPKFPQSFGLDGRSAFVIYALLRIMKPERVVETGVANGISTFYILNGMKANELGKLLSFDVKTQVGALLTSEEKKRWELFVLTGNKKNSFLNKMREFGDIDIFLHDGNHTYDWQMFEFETMLITLKQKGIFLSDDINASNAFVDFVQHISSKHSFCLINKNVTLGGIVKE